MKHPTKAIAATCAALVLASCGQDEGDPIPERRAATLDRLLEQAERQSGAGSCTTLLKTTIPGLEREAGRLPSSVGDDTRETIEDGVAHLRDLAETDCANREQDELPTTDESTTSDTTEPTTTAPTTTDDPTTTTTQSTETEPTTTTDPTTTTSPNDDGGGDEGNGGTSPGNGGTPPGQEKGGKKGGKKK